MSEVQRLGLVIVIVVAVALLTLAVRRRPLRRSRRIDAGDLAPGLYLFTSGGCDSCERARRQLRKRRLAFTEFYWEEKPEQFKELSIDAVPSLVLVQQGGKGRWWRGGVPRNVEMPGEAGGVG
ncbi:MAG: hypothetical protein WB239_05550 [Acidimicrobiia bacterium]